MTLRKHIFSIWFFMALSILVIPAIANELHFTQISTKDGLSQNTVRSILVDKKGFVWAGTLDGLNRYDGYKIITYKPQAGNPQSLVDHRIKDMFEDRDGYIWIKTYKNVFCCYNPVTESFVNYQQPDSIKSTYYVNYFESKRGDIWLWGNQNGCMRITKEGKKFNTTHFLSQYSSDTNKKTFRFLFEDSKSTIWVGSEFGLTKITGNKTQEFYTNNNKHCFTQAIEIDHSIYFTSEQGTVFIYNLKSETFDKINLSKQIKNESLVSVAKLSNNQLLLVTAHSGIYVFNINTKLISQPNWLLDKDLKGDIQLITDKNKGLWFFNHSGILWYYNINSEQVKKIKAIPTDIAKMIDLERYNIFIDSKNTIWITTYGNGLLCYDPKDDVLSNYTYSASRNSIASDYLLSITEDKFGNIWVGCEYAGFVKVVRSGYNTQVIRPEKQTSIGRDNNVRALCEDLDGNIWVGTKNGSLYVYNPELTLGKCIQQNMNPYTLKEDSKHRMWVGTKGNGLYLIDTKTYKIINHFKASEKENSTNTLGYDAVFNILEDNKGRIWLALFGGGVNLVQESGKDISFKQFFNNDGNKSYVRCLYQDRKGFIWVGSSEGIIRFDPNKLLKDATDYVTYRFNLNTKNSLSSNDIKAIYEDHKDQIWIGTAGGGLNKYIPGTSEREEHFETYNTKNGLSGDMVSGILEDNNKNLWISSENGVSRFNREQGSFMTYHFSERTHGNDFNENANMLCQNGNLVWGTLDGVLVFNPSTFVPEGNTPLVSLTNFFLYDQKVEVGTPDSPLNQSITYCNKIELNYKQNTFTIEFASLTLKDPKKNKYTYMLENYDKQWSSINQYNAATYKNLPPGKYVFKVKGSNSDGIWNEEVTSLEIEIVPPFWKSIYAYIAYAMLVVLTAYFVFRIIYKFNKLHNAVEVEKQLTNHKLRFFTNISHEFRTPLTLIRGAVENLNEQPNVPDRVMKQINLLSRNSTNLTRLIDQLLEFRKLQNNVLTLDLEQTDIVEFAREIHSGFQEVAERKKIDYRFVCELQSYNMYIDQCKVDKILFNLLSNAFKFTASEGEIELLISFDPKNETAIISVRDNGIGISKDKQHLIFSRFMQINFSSSGTGVGLSLVKEFTDVHKGKVWFESNEPEGSVFNVELSTSQNTYEGENFIVAPQLSTRSRDGESKISYPSDVEPLVMPNLDQAVLANYKMLIIDDNQDIRDFLVDEFSKYFMIDVAENGKQGLDKAIDNNPDLIICDVMMPEMDGFEVTRQLKKEFQTCHIPIILLTAHSSLEHQLEGIQSGADAYIMKPFSIKYLVTRVFKLIEQREQLKKRFSNEYVLDGNLITATDKDKDFFELIDRILENHISDTEFSVDKFSELSKLRRTIFYKKVKGITGFSPNELIKIKRLKRAAELLLSAEFTVSEVSYKVGFDDPFYFSKCFKSHFNCSPSKYGQPKPDSNKSNE